MPRSSSLALAVTCALALALALGLTWFGPLPSVAPGSLIRPEDAVHDFGTMDQGSAGEHTWTLRNDGDRPVRLTLGESRGGPFTSLTVGGAREAVVGPGRSVPVRATWRILVTAPREWEQHVTVLSDDPRMPETTLTVLGSVRPVLVVKPGWGVAGVNCPRGQNRHLDVVVYSPVKPDARLLEATPSTTKLRVALGPASRALRDRYGVPTRVNAHAVSIDIPAGAFDGRFHESVLIRTDVPGAGEFRYTISGSVN